jgi:hypothetical protein
MARGDFPFNRLELNLQPIVARPRVRAEVTVPRKESNMQVVNNIGGLFVGDR